jgi:hypothetical protein
MTMESHDWKEFVKDPEEILVFMALEGPEYTWRTVGGIARQTGLAEERVLAILAKYTPHLVRLSETPSASGRPLVGLLQKVGA